MYFGFEFTDGRIFTHQSGSIEYDCPGLSTLRVTLRLESLWIQFTVAPLDIRESTSSIWVLFTVRIRSIPHQVPVLDIETIVFPVEVTERLVPRTQTTIISVQTWYDHVSVSILHQTEPFERMADAIVEPSARLPISKEMVVSPSRRRREKSANTIVKVQPGGVFIISPPFST